MHEYAILFLYYSGAARAPLAANLARLRRLNPDAPIIPLIHDGDPFIDGSVDVRSDPCPWDTTDTWGSCDTMIYRWFPQRTVQAKRYIVCEWDTLATTSMPAFYADAWDADVGVVNVVTPASNPDWLWFRFMPFMGEMADHAMGLFPLSGTLLSHAALQAICEAPVIEDVFCELRLGTMANWAGLTLTPMPFARETISYDQKLIRLSDAPGLYHPVKHLVP